MPLSNWMYAAASHVLEKNCIHVRSTGPWRWRCALQNGSLVHLDAWLGDGFLRLASSPHPSSAPAHLLERALRANGYVSGGVGLALDAASRNLHLRADLPAHDEAQLARAMERAVNGFHNGFRIMSELDSRSEPAPPVREDSFSVCLADQLRDAAWPCTQRSANEFSAELDAEAAPPATLVSHDGQIEAGVEFVRSIAASGTVGLALAAFLLTANSALCFCHACSEQGQGGRSTGSGLVSRLRARQKR